MSVVLQFPTNSAAGREPSGRPLSAEIIIFPGVRFERRNSDLAQAALLGRKRRMSQSALDEDLD